MNNILKAFAVIGALATAAATAHAQSIGPQFNPPQFNPPPPSMGPSLTGPSAGDQLQMQLNRDLLQTRERRLQDRGGSTSPSAGIPGARLQERLNGAIRNGG
jgi:hypothetical protein